MKLSFDSSSSSSFFHAPETAFLDAMHAAGLDYSGPVIADGVLHRVKANGDRNPNSFYALHLDGIAAGHFGCWKRNIRENWCAVSSESLTAEQRAERDRRWREQQAARDADRKRQQNEAALQAQAILDAAQPATADHPYLAKKGVPAYPGILIGAWPQRQKDRCLLIPLRTADGQLATVQAIFPVKPDNGRDKDFLKGGSTRGAHFVIGDLHSADTVIIAEGYATAATLHEATGYAAVMAIDAGNLKPVAEILKKLHPAKKFIIAADNDRFADGNPGITKATATAKAIKAALAIPQFADGETGTDFNDLAALHGREAVKAAMEVALQEQEKNFSGVKTPNQSSQCSQCSQPPDDVHAVIDDAIARCQDDPGVLMSSQFLEAWREIQENDPEEAVRIRVRIKRAKPSGVLLADLDKAVRGDSPNDDYSIADELVSLVMEQAELFHDAENAAFATLKWGVRKTFKLGTQAFFDWLSYAYYLDTAAKNPKGLGRAASETALKTAVTALAGIAKHDREEQPCYLRAAPWKDGYIIDLGDEAWRVIEVLPAGWRILNQSPVRFWRPNPMQSLPTPIVGGSIDALWKFANIPEQQRPLVLAWMLEAFRPTTPFSILELTGEQGSAKSATQDKLRRLIDPNAVNLRAAPKSTEDLFVSAGCNWLVSLNNLSHLSAQQQDALCTLATGGGFASRTLYTNADETLIECKRPVIFNGIVPCATAQDLVDRIVHIDLPEIQTYKEDSILNAEFEEAAPVILGALLDLFSAALAYLPHVRMHRPPRMADFARLGEAMMQAQGHEPGAFMALFAENRRESVARGLESSPVGSAIRELADAAPIPLIFTGTMKQLLSALEDYRNGADAWPKSPRGLGDALRRQRPALKTLGLEISISAPGREGVTVRIQRKAEVREHCEQREHRLGVSTPEKFFSGEPLADSQPDKQPNEILYHPSERESGTPATPLPATPADDAQTLAVYLQEHAPTDSAAIRAALAWNEERWIVAKNTALQRGKVYCQGGKWTALGAKP